jgi:S-adenosyl methyltransferase
MDEPMTDGVNARMPNVARIYDFLLGGKDNYEEDRRAAERLLDAVPDAAVAAWDNREFLGRAVQFLVEEAGIRQFIDIGTGLPTRGSVHAVAHQFAPEARVVYVDYDPVVITHAQALLTQHPNAIAIEGDLRNPEQILTHSALRNLIDFDEPFAILLVAILHFIRDDENPYHVVSRLRDAMAPESYLVLSHVTGDDISPEVTKRVQKLYAQATAPGVPRTHAEIMPFFDGLQLIPPGLVNVASWRTDWMATESGRTIFYAGVGSKR